MADKAPSNLDMQLTQLGGLMQRMTLWMEAIDASRAFIMANAKEVIEPSEGALALMKFRRNTWMPIAEARFTEAVAEDGSYQAKAYEASLAFVKNRRGAIDVGANIGLWARRIAEDFETVSCFEPQSHARACLVRNALQNNVIVYPFALGAEPGESTLTINRLATGGAMIPITDEAKNAMQKKYPTKAEKVRVVPLDSLDLKDIDYIKIDVQGFEAEVVKGAERTIRTYAPVIVCEAGGDVDRLSGTESDAATRLLESYGYQIAKRVGKDAILVRP